MANLVVYRDRPATERVDLTAPIEGVPIDEVALRHPARIILLHHTAGSTPCGPVGAMIRILLSGPPQMRLGVEEIALRSECAEESLPSLVRYLLLGDIPTTVWWTEDLSRISPLNALVAMGRQLVYDSRQWRDVQQGVKAVARIGASPHPPDLADLNWRRLTPMRKALMQAFAPPACIGPSDALPLQVRYRAGDGALAWLLAGWFFSRLGWARDKSWPVTMEEAPHSDEMLSASLGTVATAVMDGHRVFVKYRSRCAPFSVAVPRETAAHAIVAELQTFARDRSLGEVVTA